MTQEAQDGELASPHNWVHRKERTVKSYVDMTLMDVSKLDGVADLPLAVRGKFAQALKKESEGNHEAAEALLEQAVTNELNQ